MICEDCIQAADLNAKAAALNYPLGNFTAVHPVNCGCACQHRPVGSWKGKSGSAEDDNPK